VKLKVLKLVNSVKVGKVEKTFFTYPEFNMALHKGGVYILIQDEEGNEVYTSIMNAPWWKELKESKPSKKKTNESNSSKSNTKRAKQAKGSST
jgi:hypothetical protein